MRIHIKYFVFSTALFFYGLTSIEAQLSIKQLFPQPQKVQLSSGNFPVTNFRLVDNVNVSEISLLQLKKKFNFSEAPGPGSFEINLVKDASPDLQLSGSYKIILSPEKIMIQAVDGRGVFYAIQTILQLAKQKGNTYYLPAGEIVDFPDVAYRGTVEGFYGEPWTFEDRIEQLRFYGKLKLNTYIYGPKDDPFHSSPNWRLPYPPAEAQKIKALIEEANKNFVDFVWAIHPGLDIKWTLKDSLAVLNKFEMMYELGVRNFAVFFDDISGVGTDAVKQAGLLNYIQNSFVLPKKDVGSLIMCPTEYNKAWSNKTPGTYLDILGDHLDQAIHIMWTGNSVVADIYKPDLEWVNNRIKRPAFVWWNFPVSDYVRDHLLMGPSYGLDENAAKEMSGFVSNPMDKSEASKVAIFGVALYAWNMHSYNPHEAWEAANKYVMPEASEAFQLFNANNSDLGPNGHGYRREESVYLKPTIDSFLNIYKKGDFSPALADRLTKTFDSIAIVPGIIQSKAENKRLVEQILPWLIQFEWLGKSGKLAMDMTGKLYGNNYPAAWKDYLELKNALVNMKLVDEKYNQNPYQPGVKTGSLVLTPFVKELFSLGNHQLLHAGTSLTGILNSPAPQFSSSPFTNSAKLKNQPLLLSNNSVAYSPVLESIALDSGEYVGLKLAQGLRMAELQFDFKTGEIKKWGKMEWYENGGEWFPWEMEERNGKGKKLIKEQNAKYVRLINSSNKKHSIFLKEFKLIVEPVNQEVPSFYALDGSLDTYDLYNNKKSLTIHIPDNFKNRSLNILAANESSENFTIMGLNKSGKKKNLYSGNEAYVTLDKTILKKLVKLVFSTKSEKEMKVYEIIPAP